MLIQNRCDLKANPGGTCQVVHARLDFISLRYVPICDPDTYLLIITYENHLHFQTGKIFCNKWNFTGT